MINYIINSLKNFFNFKQQEKVLPNSEYADIPVLIDYIEDTIIKSNLDEYADMPPLVDDNEQVNSSEHIIKSDINQYTNTPILVEYNVQVNTTKCDVNEYVEDIPILTHYNDTIKNTIDSINYDKITIKNILQLVDNLDSSVENTFNIDENLEEEIKAIIEKL